MRWVKMTVLGVQTRKKQDKRNSGKFCTIVTLKLHVWTTKTPKYRVASVLECATFDIQEMQSEYLAEIPVPMSAVQECWRSPIPTYRASNQRFIIRLKQSLSFSLWTVWDWNSMDSGYGMHCRSSHVQWQTLIFIACLLPGDPARADVSWRLQARGQGVNNDESSFFSAISGVFQDVITKRYFWGL